MRLGHGNRRRPGRKVAKSERWGLYSQAKRRCQNRCHQTKTT